MSSPFSPDLLVAAGALCFLLAMMGTGLMMWRHSVDDGTRQMVHDGAGSDMDALRSEYARTHGALERRYLFGYPLLLTGALLVYYIPSLLAVNRRHPRTESIFLVNTFCGLTIIGWVWALRNATQKAQAAHHG